VVVTVRNALERRRMWREMHQLRRAVDARWEVLGTTPVMVDLPALWAELGVRFDGDQAFLLPNARFADVRQAITAERVR